MKHSNGRRHKVSDKQYPWLFQEKNYVAPTDPKIIERFNKISKNIEEYVSQNYPECTIMFKNTKKDIMQVALKKKVNKTNRTNKIYFNIDEEGNVKEIEGTEELDIMFKPKEDDKPKVKVISMMPSFKR